MADATAAGPALGHRLVPRDASAEVPAWARAIGVTRVARVTGLDRCGVEVACAIRPAGQVLQVSNGKGTTFQDAKISALSEALELWACENVDASQIHWLPEKPTADFWPSEFIGMSAGLNRNRSAVQPWASAERLDRPGRVFVPASHVWCPSAGAVTVGLRNLQWTANGLGAHPDPLLARWHGLLELLEREALCRVFSEGWTPEHLHTRALRFEHERLPALEAQGMRIHCVDATPARWPIPVVAVLIVDTDTRAPPLAAGYACRRTGAEAAEAAFFEACQSRLTEIHGAREDVVQKSVQVPSWLLESRSPRRDVSKLPAWSGSLPALLRALNVAAAAVDVSPQGVPLSVARVFVPGFRISDLLL
jgi:ribosomal protein S12 methylthiotransferase accessory factor